MRGATQICVFEGIMTAPLYTKILRSILLPFLHNTCPDHHRFMQDNDPKQTSRVAQLFLEEHHANQWKTPAESPDCNPIENLWHELKEYWRREVKLRTKDELVQGILEFWKAVDVQKCQKYIRHLRKVVPKVIELNGGSKWVLKFTSMCYIIKTIIPKYI